MGGTGLEPVTPSVSCWCASQLRQPPELRSSGKLDLMPVIIGERPLRARSAARRFLRRCRMLAGCSCPKFVEKGRQREQQQENEKKNRKPPKPFIQPSRHDPANGVW